MKVIVLGDRDGEKVTPAGNAWELVKNVQRSIGVEHSHHPDEKTEGGGSEASSNAQTTEEEEKQLTLLGDAKGMVELARTLGSSWNCRNCRETGVTSSLILQTAIGREGKKTDPTLTPSQ
jgi:hypothetical protein